MAHNYRIFVEADTSKFETQVQNALKKIKGGNFSGLDLDTQNMIKEFQQALKKMQAEFKALKLEDIKIQSVDMKPLEELHKKVDAINKSIQLLNSNPPSANMFTSLLQEATNFEDKLQTAIKLKNELLGGKSTSKNSTDSISKEYLDQAKAYKQLQSAIDKSYSEPKIKSENIDILVDQANELKSKYREANQEAVRFRDAGNLGKTPQSFTNLANAMSKSLSVGHELESVLQSLVDLGQKNFSKDLLGVQNTQEAVQEMAESYSKTIANSFKTATGKPIDASNLVASSQVTTKGGNISIPITVDINAADIEAKADEVLNNLKSKFESRKDIEVNAKISKINITEAVQEAQKAIREGFKIESADALVPENTIKRFEGFSKIIADAKSYADAVKASFTDVVKIVESVNTTVDKATKGKPSTQTEQVTASKDASQNLTKTDEAVQKVTLDAEQLQIALQEIIKGLQFGDLAANVKNISDNISTFLSKITTEGQPTISTIEGITNAIANLSVQLKGLFQSGSDSYLSNLWSNIEKQFSGLTGSGKLPDMRSSANKKAYSNIIDQYKQYKSLGGTNYIDQLKYGNGTDLSKKDIKKLYSSVDVSQEAAKQQEALNRISSGMTEALRIMQEGTTGNLGATQEWLAALQQIEQVMQSIAKTNAEVTSLLENLANIINGSGFNGGSGGGGSNGSGDNVEKLLPAIRDNSFKAPTSYTRQIKLDQGVFKQTQEEMSVTVKNIVLDMLNEATRGALGKLEDFDLTQITRQVAYDARGGAKYYKTEPYYKLKGTYTNENGNTVKYSGGMDESGSLRIQYEELIASSREYTEAKKAEAQAEREAAQAAKESAAFREKAQSATKKAYGGLDLADQLKQSAQQSQSKTSEYFNQLANLEAQLQGKVLEGIKLSSLGGDKEQLVEVNSEIERLIKNIKDLDNNKAYDRINKQGTLLNISAKSYEDLKQYTDEYTKMGKVIGGLKYDEANKVISGRIQLPTGEIVQFTNRLDEANQAIRQTAVTVGTTQSGLQRFGSAFKGIMGTLVKFAGLQRIFMTVMRQFREGFQFAKTMDQSLTTISMTMDVTANQLRGLGSAAIDMAQDLSTTVDSVTSIAEVYANMNESVESILSKTQPTIMLSNASGLDVTTASDIIQGVTQQYTDLEGQEQHIVDSLERVSASMKMNFGQGIEAMSKAIQKSGSIAEEAGLSYEKLIAIAGKVTEVTRQSGDMTGTSLKTIFARLGRVTDPDEEALSADEVSAIAKAYKSVGISLYDANGEFQDIDITLSTLAEKWDTLTDAQRSYIAEQSAGRKIA